MNVYFEGSCNLKCRAPPLSPKGFYFITLPRLQTLKTNSARGYINCSPSSLNHDTHDDDDQILKCWPKKYLLIQHRMQTLMFENLGFSCLFWGCSPCLHDLPFLLLVKTIPFWIFYRCYITDKKYIFLCEQYAYKQ